MTDGSFRRRRIGGLPSVEHQTEPTVLLESLQHACARVTYNLRSTMGVDGCTALLARAIVRVEAQHPALTLVCRHDGREIHLDGIARAIERHGEPAVEAAVTALLTALTELLGKLIGADLAVRIMDMDAPQSPREQGSE